MTAAQLPPDAVAELRLAGWWQRAFALLLDVILVFFAVGVVVLLLAIVDATSYATLTLVSLVVGAAYFIGLHGSSGQTLGKRALAIKVVDAADGASVIGYPRALVRWAVVWLLSLIPVILLLIDYLWPLWDARNQALHDKAATSIVIRV